MFQNSVFYQHINNIDKDLLKQKFQAFKTNYQDPAKMEQIKSSKEEQYQEGFLRDIFVNILGYTINPEPNFNLITEKRNESSDKKNTRKADAAIIIDNKTKCVIELKGCNTTNLNKVVSQVLDYKGHHSGCRYMVISNFAKLHFYIDDATKFIEFDLFNLDYDNFKKLYTLLAYEQIKADIPALIKEQSISREEDITKKFYKDYSDFKNALFDNICELNPSFDKLELFTKTQKLLDRFLFIFFCEDKGLLAPNSMKEILERYKKLKQWDEYKPLYDLIKKFFAWIDTGFKNEIFDIFAYNGGLFKTDDLLDNLKISDDLLQKHCKKLADYNFDSEISVDILGHIFEHSISEIEIKQNELKGIQKADKRKKDGVFYTPAYITKYIVESTLGTLCEAKKNELGINDADFADINANKRKDKISKIAILKKYREFLFGLKICDPACGSGAFLNATLKFLKAEHQLIDEMENNFYGTPLQLNYNDNKILENNIYGVDINSESVDIAKLSLWLNTAKKGKKLTTLTDNIKCGNSLISDEFDWQKEFPKVFENGGFDVIIGNPPYVQLQSLGEMSEVYSKCGFVSYNKSADLYCLFYEQGTKLLKNHGYLGFIASNKWLKAKYGEDLRKFFITQTNPLLLIDFAGIKVFADAAVDPQILILRKEPYAKQTQICACKEITSDLENYVKQNFSFKEFSHSAWTFESNEIAGILTKISNFTALKDLPIEIYRGILTGFNDAFYIDESKKNELIKKDPKSAELIKPLLRGRDIKAWNSSFELYMIATLPALKLDIENYSAIKEHLLSFKVERLEQSGKTHNVNGEIIKSRKKTSNSWFETQDTIAYYAEFSKPKIIYPNMTAFYPFSYDEKGCFSNDKSFILTAKDKSISIKFLLSVLNSKIAKLWIKLNCPELGVEGREIRKVYFEKFCIPNISPESQKQLADFADEMIRLNAEISSLSNDFFTILRANNYEIAKIPTALNEFYNLDFKEFLKLTKLKIDMSEQTSLLKFFDEYKTKFKTLNEQIVKTESKINQAVYKLYELNDDEIKMIENS